MPAPFSPVSAAISYPLLRDILAEMWYVACGMLYPTEEQLFCLLFSITDESLGFTCVSFTHGLSKAKHLFRLSRVSVSRSLHIARVSGHRCAAQRPPASADCTLLALFCFYRISVFPLVYS